MGELSHAVRSLPIEDQIGIRSITAQDTNDTTPSLEMPRAAKPAAPSSVRQQHRQRKEAAPSSRQEAAPSASGSSTVSVRKQHRQRQEAAPSASGSSTVKPSGSSTVQRQAAAPSASGYVKRFAVAGRRVHRPAARVCDLLEAVAEREQFRLAECRAEE
jgi:hypothetical protein